MLQWSPKPPSGPATGMCHVALLLLLMAAASDRQCAAPMGASYLLSLLAQHYSFSSAYGQEQAKVSFVSPTLWCCIYNILF